MKKIMLLAIFCIGSIAAMAQKGEMAAGVHLNFGTAAENVGIGAKFQYGITDAIRLEPSLNYYFGDYGALDVNVNAHYLFDVAPKINVYPLVGIGIASYKGVDAFVDFDTSSGDSNMIGESKRSAYFVVNLGAGGEYALNDKISLGLELKYQIISGFNQFVVGIGATYKF